MTRQTLLTNLRIVTADAVVAGTILIEDGRIAAIDEGATSVAAAIDGEGDYLLPGLVELHTDNLEKHVSPRPGVRWPILAAVVAHDAQVAASGITTVFDAVALGDVKPNGERLAMLAEITAGLTRAVADGLLRVDHRLHLRCEVSHGGLLGLFEPFLDQPLAQLVSVMDHTPGQRQFTDLDTYRAFNQRRLGLDEAGYQRFLAERYADQLTWSAANRAAIVARARAAGLTLASHDDGSPDHVAESVADGMAIAEFPTTLAAAEASHRAGLKVLMGAPNMVRGRSHTGNISAALLAGAGLLDILSSDYIPSSLLQGAFAAAGAGLTLPAAVALVSATPAGSVGLSDRGRIAPGLRADLVRVRLAGDLPLVREVWRGGERVI